MKQKQLLLLIGIGVLFVIASVTFFFVDISDQQSWLLFLVMVILEVVFAPIPGGAIAFLGAAQLGFAIAWPLQYIGNMIGMTIVFLGVRYLTSEFFLEFVEEKYRSKYGHWPKEHPVLFWLAYAIPIFPVDAFTVLAALTSLSYKRFILTAGTAMIIYTGIVTYIGSRFSEYGKYLDWASIIAVGATLLAIVLFYINKSE